MTRYLSTRQGLVVHVVRWYGPRLVLVCDKGFEVQQWDIRDGGVVTCLACLGTRDGD